MILCIIFLRPCKILCLQKLNSLALFLMALVLVLQKQPVCITSLVFTWQARREFPVLLLSPVFLFSIGIFTLFLFVKSFPMEPFSFYIYVKETKCLHQKKSNWKLSMIHFLLLTVVFSVEAGWSHVGRIRMSKSQIPIAPCQQGWWLIHSFFIPC